MASSQRTEALLKRGEMLGERSESGDGRAGKFVQTDLNFHKPRNFPPKISKARPFFLGGASSRPAYRAARFSRYVKQKNSPESICLPSTVATWLMESRSWAMNWRLLILETSGLQKAARSAVERQLSASWLTSSSEEEYMKSCSRETIF